MVGCCRQVLTTTLPDGSKIADSDAMEESVVEFVEAAVPWIG